MQDFLGLTMKWKSKQRVSLMLAIVFLLTTAICHAQSGWTATRIGSGGKDLNAVDFVDAKHGWVAGDSGFLSYTEDGGISWVERLAGIEHSINDIYFVGKDTGFILAGGSIFETTDGGHAWREAHKFSPSDFEGATPELYSLRFNGKKRGWVVGSLSRGDVITGSILAITRDSGGSWQVLHPPTEQELIHIDFVDENAAGLSGRPALSCTPMMRVNRGPGRTRKPRSLSITWISATRRRVGRSASMEPSYAPMTAGGRGRRLSRRRVRHC